MVAGTNLKLHNANNQPYDEVRLVDTENVRLSQIMAPSHPSVVGKLRDRLLQSFKDFRINGSVAEPQACMALEEALANAVYHGNLELTSELKEDGTGRFGELARERAGKAPWKNRKVTVTELATLFGVWITIRDEGRGFDVETALRKPASPEEMLASGRGLIMMQAFTDELIFNRSGNEVTLVFYPTRSFDIRDLTKTHSGPRAYPAAKQTTV